MARIFSQGLHIFAAIICDTLRHLAGASKGVEFTALPILPGLRASTSILTKHSRSPITTHPMHTMSDDERIGLHEIAYAREYLSLSTWLPWTLDDLNPPTQFVVYSDSTNILDYDGYTVRGTKTLLFHDVNC